MLPIREVPGSKSTVKHLFAVAGHGRATGARPAISGRGVTASPDASSSDPLQRSADELAVGAIAGAARAGLVRAGDQAQATDPSPQKPASAVSRLVANTVATEKAAIAECWLSR